MVNEMVESFKAHPPTHIHLSPACKANCESGGSNCPKMHIRPARLSPHTHFRPFPATHVLGKAARKTTRKRVKGQDPCETWAGDCSQQDVFEGNAQLDDCICIVETGLRHNPV